MPSFDWSGAKEAGYSDTEIADFLAGSQNFDAGSARKSGYSDPEIITFLQKRSSLRDQLTQARRDLNRAETAADNTPEGLDASIETAGRSVAGILGNLGNYSKLGAKLAENPISRVALAPVTIPSYLTEKSGLGEYLRSYNGVADELQPQSSLSDIGRAYKERGLLDAARETGAFAAQTVIDQLPQMVGMATTGGGLTALGMAPKAAAALSPFISVLPQEAGGAYEEIINRTGTDGKAAALTALGVGAANAALEHFSSVPILKRVLDPAEGFIASNVGKTIAKNMFKSAAGEAVTEGLQETTTGLAPELFGAKRDPELLGRIAESAAAGAIAGPAFRFGAEVVAERNSPYRDLLRNIENRRMGGMPDGMIDYSNSISAQPIEVGTQGAQIQNTGTGPNLPQIQRVANSVTTDSGITDNLGVESETSPIDRYVLNRIRTDSGLTERVDSGNATSPIDRLIRSSRNNAQRRAALDAAMLAPTDSGKDTEQAVGQYPPEGWGTGVIPSREEQQRRAARREEVARRNAAAAEEARLAALLAQEEAQQQAAQAQVPTESASDQLNAVTSLLGEQEALRENQFTGGVRPVKEGPKPFTVGQSIADKLRAARQADLAAQQAQQATPNANPIQSPVEVSGGQGTEAAAQVSEGQPGQVQEPAGARPQQTAGQEAQVAAPKYNDGSEIKVGETVKIDRVVGKTHVIGTVVEIKDGQPIVRITKVGTKGVIPAAAAKKNIAPNQTVAANPDQLVRQEVKPEITEEVDLTEFDKMVNDAASHEEYGKFAEARRAADKGSDEAKQTLKTLREELGDNTMLGMEAAYRVSEAPAVLDLTADRAYNSNTAAREYAKGVKRWVDKSLGEGKQLAFSRRTNALWALRNAYKAVDAANTAASISDNQEDSENLSALETAAAVGAAGEVTESSKSLGSSISRPSSLSFFDLIRNTELVGGEIVKSVRESEKKAGRKLTPAEFTDAVVAAFSNIVKSSSESFNETRRKEASKSKAGAEAVMSLSIDNIIEGAAGIAEKVSGDLQEYYNSKAGLVAVEQAVTDGTLGDSILSANQSAPNTGNQSLVEGRYDLKTSIETVIDSLPQDSLLRQIAQKLLDAGINANVVVLSDEAFDALQIPGITERTAVYDSNPASNTIYVRQSANSHDYLVMHEAVHAATVWALRNDVNFRNEIARLRAEAAAVLGENAYGLTNHGNNFTNLAEFVAEALSNPEFQSALKQIGAKQSIWTRFKNAIAKALGFKTNERTMLDEVLDIASNNFKSNKAAGVSGNEALFAGREFRSKLATEEALTTPGLSTDATDAIERLAATQAASVPSGIVAAINASSKAVQRKLSWLVRQSEASASPVMLSSLPLTTSAELDQASEAAHGVEKFSRRLDRAIEVEENRVKRAQDVITSTRSGTSSELSVARTVAGMKTALAEAMLRDYNNYLSNKRSLASTTDLAMQKALDAAAESVQRIRAIQNEFRSAMSVIAEAVPDSVVSAATSPTDIFNYVVANKVLDGKVRQDVIDFLLTPSVSGKAPLESFKRLVKAIQLIKKLKADAATASNEVDAFETVWAAIHGHKSARAVSSTDFARKYASVTADQREAIETAKMLSAKIDAEDEALLNSSKALQIMQDLKNSPEFKAQIVSSIDLLNTLVGDAEGVRNGNDTIYRVNGKEFRVTRTMDAAKDQNNKAVVLAALTEIEAALKTETDPYQIRRLKQMQTHLALYGNTLTDAAIGINQFDVVNRIRIWAPILRPLIDRMFIFRQVPGRIGAQVRNLLKLGNSVSAQIQAAKEHPRHGEGAVNFAAQKAIESHPGMDADQWDVEVLNPLLASRQESTQRSLSVGKTTIFGHVITAEDVAAAEVQARFADALYKATKGVERGGISFYFPTLVQESYSVGGKKQVRLRYAYASGAFTTPRSFNRSNIDGSPSSIAEQWITALIPGDDVATRAARKAILADPRSFITLALSHVVESNPEYKRNSEFEKIYKALGAQYEATGKYPATFDELVNDIASKVVLTVPDTVAYVEERLMSEIDAYMQKYRSEYLTGVKNAADELTDYELSPTTMMQFLESSNNFNKPRGSLVAPSVFYTHTLTSDQAKGSIALGAMLPIRLRQLKLMKETAKAIKEEISKLDEDLKAAKNKGTREFIKVRYLTSKSNVMKGTALSDYSRLQTILKQIETSIDVYKTMIEKPLIGSGQTSAWDKFLQLRLVGLVSSLVTASTNYISSTMAGSFIPKTYLTGYKATPIITQPITSIASLVFDTAAYLSSTSPELARWLQANKNTVIPVLRKFARTVDQMQRMKAVAAEAGFAPEKMTLSEKAEMIRRIGGYGSPMQGEGHRQNFVVEALEKLFSKGMLPNVALMIQNIPASVDRAANIISMLHIDEALQNVAKSGIKIIETRAATGGAGWDNFSNPANGITEDEASAAGWSRETLINLKQAFSGIGGLENMLLDYWKRVNAAKAAGTDINEVPAIGDQGFYKDVALEMVGMTNAPVDSMRPDATKGRSTMSGIYNFIFTFSSWFNAWFSSLGTLAGVDPKRGYINGTSIAAVTMLALMVMLAMNGMAVNELRGFIYELTKGRPYSVIRLGDLARDMNPATAAKLFGASIALMVPYAGEYIASALGSQTYRSSLTDIASLSQPLQLGKTFYDAISNGAKTGDWTGVALQTIRGTVPGSDMIVNRLPQMAARDSVNDATRVARVVSGDLELSNRGGGGGAAPTKFGSLVKQAVAASAAGDQAGAQKLLEQAAEEKGGSNPWGAIRSALQSQKPETKAFGRKLTDEERTGLLGRMSGSQRQTFDAGTKAVENLMSSIPKKGGKAAAGPFAAINRKFRSLSNSTKPKALKAIKTKLASLKPKKLKIPGVKSVSGSARLQRATLGAGASARNPGALRMPAGLRFA